MRKNVIRKFPTSAIYILNFSSTSRQFKIVLKISHFFTREANKKQMGKQNVSRFLIRKRTAGKKIQGFTPEQVVFVPRICQKSIFEPTAGTKQNRQRLFSNA